jgi:Contractile injection system tube protein
MLPGQLKKLTIEAFKKIKMDAKDRVGEPFSVQFNPSTYSRVYDIDYDQHAGTGNSGAPPRFGQIKPQDYTFELVFDGTGVDSFLSIERMDVHDEIEKFLDLCARINGEIHRPNYLRVSWGKLILACVLKSATIAITLFKPDGKPLRAKVTAVFSESIPEEQRVGQEAKQSPDLTHVRFLRRGETLPNLTDAIYGDPGDYAAVARFNDLDHFRALVPGAALRLPPAVDLPDPSA